MELARFPAEGRMHNKIAQLFLSLTNIVVSVALLWHSYSPEYQGMGDVHSVVFFPQIILYVWSFLAVLLLIQEMLARPAELPRCNVRILTGAAAMLVLFVLMFEPLGFLVSAGVFFLGNSIVLGYRRFIIMLPLSIIVPLSVWLCFEYVLQIPLPSFSL